MPAWSPLTAGAVVSAGAAVPGGGPDAESLAARIAGDWSMQGALLTDSGTGALTLAMRAAKAAAPGRPVALPAWACYDLATAVDGADIPVVLYDLDPETLGPEPQSFRAALAGGVAAAVVVHFFGLPVDIPSLRGAMPSGTIVIEDAAQCAGAAWRGKRLGAYGDLSVLSFGRGKGQTAGRGGALLASASSLPMLEQARRWVGPAQSGAREVVQLAAQWLLGWPWAYALPASLPFLRLGETVHHAPSPVHGTSRAARAALQKTLALSDREASGRRMRAAGLLAAAGAALRKVRVLADAEPGYLRLPFIATRDQRAAALLPDARAHGIMPGYPLALCDLAGFRERVGNAGAGFPGARRIAETLITLPTHGRLSEADMRWLERWVSRGKN